MVKVLEQKILFVFEVIVQDLLYQVRFDKGVIAEMGRMICNCNKTCVLLLLLIVVSPTYANDVNNYVYKDPFNPTKTILLDIKERRLIIGDVGASILVCGNDVLYYCFSSKSFSFSVPITNIDVTNQWEFGGIKYTNNGVRTIKIFDSSIVAYSIMAVISGIKYHFLYSKERGLLVINIISLETGISGMYFLSGKYGFAHHTDQ